jgi:MFS family permease
MPKFTEFVQKIPSTNKNKLIYLFGIVILLFSLFDGIITYLIPLVTLEHGLSKTLIGIIIGSAAVAGAFFDFAIYKIFKNTVYRRLFIVMFSVALVYLFVIWRANSFILYVLAMVMWGFYYDLKNFGTMDFTCRYFPKHEQTANFGLIQVFQSLGCLLAPLIAGFLIIDTVGNRPFLAGLLFLVISTVFFIALVLQTRQAKQFIPEKPVLRTSLFEEISAWKKTGKIILPVLILGAFYTAMDSFFLILGPLFAENLPLEPFDGIFLFAYLLPASIMGGFIGKITKKFGDKNSIIYGLLIGSSILSFFYFFKAPLMLILIVFSAFCFLSIISPITHGIYAHYIHRSPKEKKEIQELGDFFENFGYIIGPVIAGIIADQLGIQATFSVLGITGLVFALFLIFVMPKNKF